MIAPPQKQRIEALLSASPVTGPLLARWFELGLGDKWLCAGAVYQTIWNDLYGLPPAHGIKDMDVIWFARSDPPMKERLLEKSLRQQFPGLPPIDAKNEAHVHRWYAKSFGSHIRPYRSVADAVRTFPTVVGSIAVQPDGAGGLHIIAPFGVEDMMQGVVRANRRQVTPEIYNAKWQSWIKNWPHLQVQPWSLGVG
ncbi:MAG: nucleotidyltransferase family protein [Alphaproteobacteria bacterium]